MKKDEEIELLDEVDEEELTLEEIEKDENNNRRRRIIFLLLFLILLFFATFGITYTLYKGDSGENEHEVITDKIIFTYSDVDRAGSGIYLKDALPTSDLVGKNMLGTNQYFDFFVTATSKNSRLKYKVLAVKGDDSTIPNSDIRIYLTALNGTQESELLLNNFSNLKQERINGTDYYVLYEKTLDKGIKDYSDSYRLRMWIREGAEDYELKRFSLKVDVTAEQIGD